MNFPTFGEYVQVVFLVSEVGGSNEETKVMVFKVLCCFCSVSTLTHTHTHTDTHTCMHEHTDVPLNGYLHIL